jgi:glycosyltransferase involved in cell wall biosynthesis
MAMLEAQAAGLPVVSCATRGVPDVVGHGRTGLLAAPGDEAGLAALARDLLLDARKRGRFGAAAAQAVADEHSLAAAAASLSRLFAGLRVPAGSH